MINIVILEGRLTEDVQVKRVTTVEKQENVSVADFVLAVNQGESADFLRCVVWGRKAENLQKYTGKGSRILVEGMLKTGTYEKNGQKHYTVHILATDIRYLTFTNNQEDAETQDTPDGEFTTAPDEDFESLFGNPLNR